jgi:hypothetical protein
MYYQGSKGPRGYDYPTPSVTNVVIPPERPAEPKTLSREDSQKIRDAVRNNEHAKKK